jgi:hypothetical protein
MSRPFPSSRRPNASRIRSGASGIEACWNCCARSGRTGSNLTHSAQLHISGSLTGLALVAPTKGRV